MTDHYPRYVTLHQNAQTNSQTRAVSYVLDSWYSYHVVATIRSSRGEIARASAEFQAVTWNLEHDAWLTDEVAA